MRKLLIVEMALVSLAAAPVAAAATADDVKPIHHLQHVYRHAQRAVENPGTQPKATAQFVPNADQYRGIPVMTLRAALQLPPGQLPRVFISPNPYQSYPDNVHQTDGLSRNSDDCMRWGCIDHR
jgi:hypothetical protein